MIEQHQHRLTLGAGKCEARCIRQTIDTVAVHLRAGHFCEDGVFKFIAHRPHLRGFVRDVLRGDFARFAERDDARDVLSACALAVFLTAAGDEWEKLCAAVHVEHADSFWRMEFVSTQREEIHLHGIEFHRQFSNGLHCVGMKNRAFRAHDFRDLLDGKSHASFVVRPHDRNERRFVRHRALQFAEIDLTLAVHTEPRHRVTTFC